MVSGAISRFPLRQFVRNRVLLKKARSLVNCCGIIGYCGDKDASDILTNGVRLLQNRGYDSCGISTLDRNKIYTTKFASHGTTSNSIDLLSEHAPLKHKGHRIGIAHTRWATHGGKTDQNAHPHQDWKQRISLVHNGTIENFDTLKAELEAHGIPFKSETDTEVIANLIGFYLDQGQKFPEAVKTAIGRLEGTWGLLVIHADHPDEFMCARNGSPLIIGSSGGEVFIASEPLALARYTNEYVALNDGDVIHVSSQTGIDCLQAGRDKRAIPTEEIDLDPTPFTHWTVKEIYEQPRALSRAINFGARLGTRNGCKVKLGGLESNASKILEIHNLILTGCGTSLHAAMYGERIMRYLSCFDGIASVDSSELTSSTFFKPHSKCGLLALSQSGETRDLVTALEKADSLNVQKFSVVNQVGSLIARMTNCGVYINAGREVAVASTKAFTSQVAVLSLIASWFGEKRNSSDMKVTALTNALSRLPLVAAQLLGLDSQCRRLANQLIDARSLFVLGKGFGHPVALEGALKIKEISYIHAEGYPAGALKHGPFALLDEKEQTPVILIVLRDSQLPAMLNAVQQTKARGARIIVITDDKSCLPQGCCDEIIEIPSNGLLTALGAIIPIQLLAYHLALLRNINPDKPRGLAKTVTVM